MTSPTTIGLDMPDLHGLDPDEPDLSVQDVAKLLNVRPETVRRYLANGAFPGAYRTTDSPKAVWRIPRTAIIAWRNRGRGASP